MDDLNDSTCVKTGLDCESLNWQKSSRSTYDGNCVEVAVVGAHVLLRDSKDPSGPRLKFDSTIWTAFVDRVRVKDL